MKFRSRARIRTRLLAFAVDAAICLLVGLPSLLVSKTVLAFISIQVFGEVKEFINRIILFPTTVCVYAFVFAVRGFSGGTLGARALGLRTLSKLTAQEPVARQNLILALELLPIFLVIFSGVFWVKYLFLGSLGFCVFQLVVMVADIRRESIFDKLSRTVVVPPKQGRAQAMQEKPALTVAPPQEPAPKTDAQTLICPGAPETTHEASSGAGQPFTSPYLAGATLKDTKLFFGRREELGLLKDTIAHVGSGPVIVLGGPKRSGKTCLMEYIVENRATLIEQDASWGRIVPVLVSVASMPVGTDVEFYLKLREKFLEVTPKAGDPGPEQAQKLQLADTQDFGTINAAQTAFAQALEQALAANPGKILLLMLDECHILEARASDKRLTPGGVASYLAFVKRQQPRLCYILAGPWDFRKKQYPFLHILLGGAHQAIILGPLSEDAARQLVAKPVAGCIAYTEAAIEHILRLTGNHPYYIQLLCNELVWRSRHKQKVEVRDVADAADDVAKTPPGQLPMFWSESTPHERAVMAALARISFDEYDFASAKTVYRQVRSMELGESGPTMYDVGALLEDLVEQNILKVTPSHCYTFNIDLLRMWIRVDQLHVSNVNPSTRG